MIFVFFVYGLAFFILGLTIFLYPKKGSAFKLASDLWLIAAFGISHGINEWIDMFILIQKPMVTSLSAIHMVTLPVSFLFLVQFGTKVIAETKKKYSALKALPTVLFITWAIIVAVSDQRLLMGDIWARYLLGAPGIFLTFYALILQLPEFKKLNLPVAIRNLRLAAVVFFIYGFFTPIVPRARFFPASFFNYTVFLDRVGIPVQIFRALSAILLAYSMVQILSMFDYETQETIRRLAYDDALTGLPNRLLFNDRLNVALAHGHRSGEKLAVMMLDLDRFKDVNDTLGHNVGDELLACVGSRLTNLLRAGDTVARFGGDEFMLLLPDIAGAEGAIKIANEILEACRKPFLCSGHEVHTSTSIGIAIYPDDDGDAYTLIKHADVSMYHAKDSGRNNYQLYGLVPSKA